MRSADADRTPWLLGGVLALGVAVQLLLPAAPLPAAALHAERSAHMEPTLPLPIIAAYVAIAERPLFSPSRSASGATVEDAAPVGGFSLLGVASAAGGAGGAGGATAVIRFGAGGDPQVVRLGETLQGWRVTAIGRDMAVVSRGAVSQTLRVGASASASPDVPSGGRAPVAVRVPVAGRSQP